MTIISSILCIVFTILGLLHIYWAFGGRLAFHLVIPEVNKKPVFQPGRIASITVALILFLFAFLAIVLNWPDILNQENDRILTYLGWVVCVIFALRAVGDFKYVGFVKKVRGTPFARMDSLFYSPLCVILSILLGVLSCN